MAISGSYRERLVALYHAYNPAKLHTVEGTLKKFSGKEEVAIQQLVRRYGPEPAPLTSQETSRLLTTASTGGVSRASPSVGPTTETCQATPPRRLETQRLPHRRSSDVRSQVTPDSRS
ncbi:hypothetical_protein [Leishmania braziliensis MHOM/BR/75/M2904]|uniref:Hypothetical_protein n=1 Tax=Leishmania braziliensis MHOM/BR/75/M2904 TaxID=420245 RepID=A0A3P3ZI60_LEIBR|nr:hypothetical_protein [Leishmania braziliensis MHOM/BR/75/M2904]